MKLDQKRVGALLIDTVSLLCRNGLEFDTDIKVQGLLGITVDDNDVFLVHFNEILSEKQSGENQSAEVETAIAPPSISISPSIQDDGLRFEQSNVRTGFGPFAGVRHHYSNLPRGVLARRRARKLGQHWESQQKMNKSESFETDTGTYEDTKQSDFKAEVDDKVLPSLLEEQDDVILVESEEQIEHTQNIGSYIKDEETSQIHNQENEFMYSHADSYTHMNLSTSGLVHGQEVNIPQGASSVVSYTNDCDDDVKANIQMCSSSEILALTDADWQSAESNDPRGSNYNSRSMNLEPSIPNSSHSFTYMSSRPRQRSTFNCQPNMVSQRRRDHVPLKYARKNDISSRLTSNTRKYFEDESVIPNSQHVSSLTTSFSNRRPMSQMMPSAKMMHTVTKYVCNICDATFNHHCTLLTHQVRKHGRQKNARRGRPSAYTVPSFDHHNYLELE